MRRIWVTLLVILLPVAGIGLALGVGVPDLYPSCVTPSEPTAEEKRTQEDLVHARLHDARDLEWTVMDCDDDGEVFLRFATSQAPATARDAFYGRGCTYHTVEENNDIACVQDGTEVVIFFEQVENETQGELVLPVPLSRR